VSTTAIMNAVMRAYHSAHEHPPIFDDTLAAELLLPEERTRFENALAASLPHVDPEAAGLDRDAALARSMRLQSGPVLFTRARLVEDLVQREHVTQYVILGAGLDTFAFRNRDARCTVFEVDLAKTQADKRMRIERAGWTPPENLRFVEVDLEGVSLAASLDAAGFDRTAHTCVAWMGVTYYLTHEAFRATLERLATLCAPRSLLVFDHLDSAALDDARAELRVKRMRELLARAGEPIKTGIDPDALPRELASTGWHVEDQLAPKDIQERYLGAHPGYRARAHFHFAVARRS
jgi:methyltransferase (TIGR00027 family)